MHVNNDPSIDSKLDRLVRLMGSDQGFYVLALHSFVEWYLRYVKRYSEEHFPDLTWRFRNELMESREGFIDGLTCLTGLARQHRFTNEVRHAFEAFDEEEARGATLLFLRFCGLIGIADSSQARTLGQNLEIWKNRRTILEQSAHLKTLERMLKELQSRNTELLKQKEERDRLKLEVKEARLTVNQVDLELERLKGSLEKKDEKIDTLRRERRYAAERQAELEKSLSQYSDLERYLSYLARFSLYTRTRMDYERMVSQLTPEQEEVINSVELSKHLFIKGGPGTGKSLVLIELIRRVLPQKELDFGAEPSVVFITFTTTLAKYNQYISHLRGLKLPLKLVRTIDSLLYGKFRSLFGFEYRYNFDFYEEYFEEREIPSFFTSLELSSEIENFLFGHMVSREEYIDEMIPRSGMRKRLTKEQRKAVWQIRDEAAAAMELDKRVSKEYVRMRLARYLTEHPENEEIRDISYLFVDETQDLTAAAVTALNELSRRSMVFAGDFDQSLYCFQNPFTRGGIHFQGRTRILRTNFRNTVQIHDFAEKFRQAGGGRVDTENLPFPFREGPTPEVFRSASSGELQNLLIGKLKIYLEELAYEPETVCVLVPSNTALEDTLHLLDEAGIPVALIREKSFQFDSEGKVRLGTLHSSKGLDFSVVMLFLPCIERKELYDEEQTELLLRNLIYVGMTRAMDCLDLFVGDEVELEGL
jgi:UvrD/REP helicase N-terminal domain